MEQIKLISMTVVLTVLIWAGADSLVNETTTVPVYVEIIPPASAPDMVVDTKGSPGPFDLEVSGPRRVIEDIRTLSPLRLRLSIDERPTGDASIRPDRTALRAAVAVLGSEFGKLSVISLQPNTLDVVVDHMVTRDVRLQSRTLTLQYDIEPRLDPGMVVIRMRESVAMSNPSGDNPVLDIGPELERLLKDQPIGHRTTVAVPVDVRGFGPDAVANPKVVEVTATVRAGRTTADIPTVPILLAVSFANLERTLQPVTRDGTPMVLVTRTITVTGLHDDVARLQRGETRAQGIIQLKQEDLEDTGSLKLATPEYSLPPGIELAADPSPIEFKLIDVRKNKNTP